MIEALRTSSKNTLQIPRQILSDIYPQQMLPRIEETMIRKGNIPETRCCASVGRLFDVTGTLTDPKTGIIDYSILDAFMMDLRASLPIGISSGRPLKWMDNTFLKRFEKDCTKRKISMENFVVIGSYGHARITYDRTNTRTVSFTSAAQEKLYVPDKTCDVSADRFIDFLDEKRIKASTIIVYGAKDLAQADRLSAYGEQVAMVYVGKRENIERVHKPYPVRSYPSEFVAGTLRDFIGK